MSDKTPKQPTRKIAPYVAIFPALGESARTFGAILHAMPETPVKVEHDYFRGLEYLEEKYGIDRRTARRHIQKLIHEHRCMVARGREVDNRTGYLRRRTTYHSIFAKSELLALKDDRPGRPGHLRFPLAMIGKLTKWSHIVVYSLAVWRCDRQDSGVLGHDNVGWGAAYVKEITGLQIDVARRALQELHRDGFIIWDAAACRVTLPKAAESEAQNAQSSDNLTSQTDKMTSEGSDNMAPQNDILASQTDNVAPQNDNLTSLYENNHLEDKHKENHPSKHSAGRFSFDCSQGGGEGDQSADLAEPPLRTGKSQSPEAGKTKEELAAISQKFLAECPQFGDLHELEPGVAEIVLAVWLGTQSGDSRAVEFHAAFRKMRQFVDSALRKDSAELTSTRGSYLFGTVRGEYPGVASQISAKTELLRTAKSALDIACEASNEKTRQTAESQSQISECCGCKMPVRVRSDDDLSDHGFPACAACRSKNIGWHTAMLWLDDLDGLLNNRDLILSQGEKEIIEKCKRGEHHIPSRVKHRWERDTASSGE